MNGNDLGKYILELLNLLFRHLITVAIICITLTFTDICLTHLLSPWSCAFVFHFARMIYNSTSKSNCVPFDGIICVSAWHDECHSHLSFIFVASLMRSMYSNELLCHLWLMTSHLLLMISYFTHYTCLSSIFYSKLF